MCSTKLFKSLFTVFLLSMGLFSCSDDYNPVNNRTDQDKLVKISIHTPSSSTVKATRAAEPGESAINKIKVLVLQQENNNYVFKYMVDGQQIVPDQANDNLTTFTALLTNSEVPLKLILIANHNDVFNSGNIDVSMTEQQVKNLLIDSFQSGIEENLPIFGEIKLDNLITDKVNVLSTTMSRGIARVDVLNQAYLTDKFILESVYVYRANNKIQLIPNDEAFAGLPSLTVKAPSVPANATTYTPFYKDVNGDPNSIKQLYLPESSTVTDPSDQVLGATCLVVGGRFEGDASPSYYRVDFNSGISGHPFGQVLRNYKYVFNIKEVSNHGWTNPDDAANNESTSIIATLQVWDELTSEMYFSDNDNYLGISSRKITLDYYKGATETVYLQTTIPFTLQAAENGTGTGTIISEAGDKITTDFYEVEIRKESSDGEDIYQLVVTSTGENNTDDLFTGQFLVSTAFWKFDVTVEQVTFFSTYLDKEINVLTITSLPGDLGTSDGIFTAGVSGDAMRKVLENPANFSNSGTIPVKSIIVHSFSNDMISSSNSSYLNILAKMLQHVQVVHLPKNCSPSSEASQLIIDWLEEEYYRVLIIGMDTDNTNTVIRNYYDDLDGFWRYDDSAAITELGTPIFEDDPRHLLYFNGRFGSVPMNLESMGFVDGDMSYNIGFNWNTTVSLLVARGGDDNEGKMTHGINMEKGLFYCGESEITSSRGAAMSPEAATDGTITTKFDMLMANVWAWIIDRVIRG